MTAIRDIAPSILSVSPEPTAPRVRDVVARVAISLLVAVVIPAFLLWAMLVTFGFGVAVTVVLAWMAGAMCWRRATGRPVSGLLLLGLTVMSVRTTLTLMTGSTFIYFVQPAIADFVIAAVFLGSLWTARPIVAQLAPDFYPMDDVRAARPEMCTHFRRLTVLWGTVMLAKGVVTLWLLATLSTVDFVVVKSCAIFSLTVLASTVTIAWSYVVLRHETRSYGALAVTVPA
ncbi:MAG TPA: VC0807 family protein [Nocardioides sp.]|nr:VC0807 family protein [Nocardioides sp.]